ncbi:hypothetical protein EGJ55_22860 [Pseudomonas moraviensis]|nr:hypothetical protein EGJ55_22860 [Pseudomonas moraviensis]
MRSAVNRLYVSVNLGESKGSSGSDIGLFLVGASLLAKALYQSPPRLNDAAYSRAGSLPQGFKIGKTH